MKAVTMTQPETKNKEQTQAVTVTQSETKNKSCLEFQVTANTQTYEVIRLVGSTAELGMWKVDDSIEMKRESEKTQIWTAQLQLTKPITPDTRILYRYLCGRYFYNDKNERQLIVTRYETHFFPRLYDINKDAQQPDVFGLVGKNVKTDEGWLTHQSEIRISVKGDALTFWNAKLNEKSCNLRVIPTDFRRIYIQPPSAKSTTNSQEYEPEGNDTDFSLTNHSECLLSVVTDEEGFKFQEQGRHGRKFSRNDYFIYRVQTLSPNTLGFCFKIYLDSTAGVGPDRKFKRIGICYMHPFVGETSGQKLLTFLSLKSRPLGQMKIEITVVQPCQKIPRTMDESFVRYWKYRQPLGVGHRGMGTSYKKAALIRENTIGSLNSAAKHGADFVEFDVQLTKDLIPILFHDFKIRLAVQQAFKRSEYFLHEDSVHRLTLSELGKLRLFHEKDAETDTQTLNEANDEKEKPFPTLNEIFRAIDPNVGFNIEVKYPMYLQAHTLKERNFANILNATSGNLGHCLRDWFSDEQNNFVKHGCHQLVRDQKDGQFEADGCIERNLYVDTILTEVFKHTAARRRIVFSSFDPMICAMIKLKQNQYPAMFLTQGETKRYPMYADPLAASLSMAVVYAISNEILGVSLHTEQLLKDATILHLAIKKGLICFVWGDDLNTAISIQYFKRLGVHGIIIDRINETIPGKRNTFVMEQEEKSIRSSMKK